MLAYFDLGFCREFLQDGDEAIEDRAGCDDTDIFGQDGVEVVDEVLGKFVFGCGGDDFGEKTVVELEFVLRIPGDFDLR